jgi:hypothetical protein
MTTKQNERPNKSLDSPRVNQWRTNIIAQGGRRLTVVLSPKATRKLDALCRQYDDSARTIIEWLLDHADAD